MRSPETVNYAITDINVPDPPPYVSPRWIGVNFSTGLSSYYQNGSNVAPPANYVEDSFRYFYSGGIRVVRVPYYWESYELDRTAFLSDLLHVLTVAAQYNIKVILDNHQWETSSWLGWGIGFPNSVMEPNFARKTGVPNYNDVANFWHGFWNNTIRNRNGILVREAQARFLAEVIEFTKNHSAVLAYEFLNEPEIWFDEDFPKVAEYNAWIMNRLAQNTTKKFVICWCLPRGNVIDLAGKQTWSFPPDLSRVLAYDAHAYPPSSQRMSYFESIVSAMPNIPLWFGEFNSGFTSGASLNQAQVDEYLTRFKQSPFTNGWSLWRWNYFLDTSIPAFNLCTIQSGRIIPNNNFLTLTNAIARIKP